MSQWPKDRVLIVRPSEAQARKPYDLYLSRIVMEFQNSFFRYKLWGFSSFSFFQEWWRHHESSSNSSAKVDNSVQLFSLWMKKADIWLKWRSDYPKCTVKKWQWGLLVTGSDGRLIRLEAKNFWGFRTYWIKFWCTVYLPSLRSASILTLMLTQKHQYFGKFSQNCSYLCSLL